MQAKERGLSRTPTCQTYGSWASSLQKSEKKNSVDKVTQSVIFCYGSPSKPILSSFYIIARLQGPGEESETAAAIGHVPRNPIPGSDGASREPRQEGWFPGTSGFLEERALSTLDCGLQGVQHLARSPEAPNSGSSQELAEWCGARRGPPWADARGRTLQAFTH